MKNTGGSCHEKMEFTRKQAWELLWDGVAFSRQFLFAVAVNVFTAPNNIAPGIDRIGNND